MVYGLFCHCFHADERSLQATIRMNELPVFPAFTEKIPFFTLYTIDITGFIGNFVLSSHERIDR